MTNNTITRLLFIDEHRCGYLTLNNLIKLSPGDAIFYDGFPYLKPKSDLPRPRKGNYLVSKDKGIRVFHEGNHKKPKLIGLAQEYHLKRSGED